MPHAHLQQHIDLIARHEQDFHQNRTRAERMGDTIAVFAGNLGFVAVHTLLFVGWIGFNSLHSTQQWHFDPYPYPMLDTIVALEAILLASFILMRQVRTSRRAEQRDHLMLQLLLLTEKETTKLLEINLQVATHLGLHNVADDVELASLTQETSIDEVADHIREALPTEA